MVRDIFSKGRLRDTPANRRKEKSRKKKQKAKDKIAEQTARQIDAKRGITRSSKPKTTAKKQPAPIVLKKKEEKKTGLAALVEKDTFLGKAAKVATSPKTTAVLGATLVGVAAGGAVAGALATTAARRATGTVITKTLETATKSITTQRNIVGKALHQSPKGLKKVLSVNKGVAARFATNTKTTAGTASVLQKAGMSNRAALGLAAVATTYPFAIFEVAEATDKIGIAMNQAANAGDVEEVQRLGEELDEMLDLSVWEKIIGLIPFANVAGAAAINIKAAITSKNSQVQTALKKQEKREEEEARLAETGETKFETSRRESDEASFERKREFSEEQSEKFEKIDKERAEAKAEQDKKDQTTWDEIEAKRKADKETERAADDAYWKGITEANALRKANDRAADEAYWAEIKGKNLDDEDKRIIDEWNAGKSSLNFGWLFL